MDIFKSLTFGVKFNRKSNLKVIRDVPKEVDIKVESDDDEFKPKIKRKKISEEFMNCKNNEKINKLHKQHNIKVKGLDQKEKPIESFEELFTTFNINDKLQKNIISLNFKEPTPVQVNFYIKIHFNKLNKLIFSDASPSAFA